MSRSDAAVPGPTPTPAFERVGARSHLWAGGLTGLIVLAWVALAMRTPTSTFHFAPLIAAGAWPVALRGGAVVRVAPVDAARGAIGAVALTVVAAGVLLASDSMRGPTLWGSGHAVLEVLPAAVVGAAAGYRFARCSPL